MAGFKENQKEETDSLVDILRVQSGSLENSYSLPKEYLMYGAQEISSFVMTQCMVQKLKTTLIDILLPGASGLSLVYSSELHGFALSTLMSKAQEGPSGGCFILAIMEDDSSSEEYQRVFGAIFTNRLEYQRTSFGTSNTTLFRFSTPRKQCTQGAYNSILNLYGVHGGGESSFYIMAKKEYLAFGCSDARFGLVLAKDLLRGESHPVDTFRNERLSHNEAFNIRQIELWYVRV
ncbi:hypothetical protein NEHOM01_1582 [Nematocida homosporus]|uniref:uncharacterized protein n=1 Tax=Nematocida homosporus TaxID=1912981 RepID=UPI0022201E4D|nr:uncharacterized protein NEHOM01_1582 [Nematocida homosporus]KAI5186614.1 hypothetical protein NEHOM01_1582 [Nematocida homosporus]